MLERRPDRLSDFLGEPEDDEIPCEGPASITVNLVQFGEVVKRRLHGTLVLDRSLRGERIFGSLGESGGPSYGRALGTASSNRIHSQVTQDYEGDGDDPDHDHDDHFVSTSVDLSR